MYTNRQKLKATANIFGVFGPLIGGVIFCYAIPFFGNEFSSISELPVEDGTSVFYYLFSPILFYLLFSFLIIPASYFFGLIPSIMSGAILWHFYKDKIVTLGTWLLVAAIYGAITSTIYLFILNFFISEVSNARNIFTLEFGFFSYIPGSIGSVICAYFSKKYYFVLQPNN